MDSIFDALSVINLIGLYNEEPVGYILINNY